MNYDTLDYLIPPVRKRCEKGELTQDSIRRTQLLNTKLATRIAQFSEKTNVVTSSSTELKTVTNKLHLEEFSITNIYKKKAAKKYFNTNNQQLSVPSANVIKITVVPITTNTKNSKTVLKRKQIIKNIHKAVSNTNSSITNNTNCPKQRRGNQNIRATSSVDLFKSRWKPNTKHDELSLNHLTYTKTIINSLNMNHKDRPEKFSLEPHEIHGSPRCTNKSYKELKEGCMCKDIKINNVLDDMNSRKNRLTIIGRLGITENDQYILNCAATVNNKPIETFTNEQNVSYNSVDQFENINGINKVTRATQADINISFTTHRLNDININKNIQYHSKYSKDVATAISDCNLKEPKSPLIVISVYPTNGTGEDIKDLRDFIQINQLPDSRQNDKNPNMKLTTVEQTIGNTAGQKSATRSSEKRPGSPPFKTVNKEKIENRTPSNRSPSLPNKNYNNNKIENRSLRSRSRSPSVKTSLKENSKNLLKEKISQKSVRSPDRQPKSRKVLPQKERVNRNPVIVNTAQTPKVHPFRNSYGGLKETNVKKNKIKKAIVESYTQRMLMPLKGKNAFDRDNAKPKSNASSVTIDIDGDNEKYRVLFLQDNLNTDLNIRKIIKTHKQTFNDFKTNDKGNNREVCKKNCSMVAKKTSRNNLESLSNLLNNSRDLGKSIPGIKIRDSLEMQHWREEDYDQNKKNNTIDYEPTIKIKHKKTKKCDADYNDDFSVPQKHYRGDQCCIQNPAVRDQEIRDLLGIKKLRTGKSEFVQEVLPEFVGQKLHYNLHPAKCVKSNNSSISHPDYISFNEIQNKSNINGHRKLTSTWTQCEESTIDSYKQMILNRNIQVFLQVEQFTKQKPIMLSRKQYEKVKKTIQKKSSNKISQDKRGLNNSGKCSVISIGEMRKKNKKQTPVAKICKTVQAECNSLLKQKTENKETYNQEANKTLKALEKVTNHEVNLSKSPKQVISSMEIRYASLDHLRHVTFSASNVKSKPGSLLCLTEKDCPSVQTIFKGHKKCVTPNLGTSAYSLYSDEEINDSDNKCTSYPCDEKPKRPFLRRLMSCLIMRSNRASEAILPRQYGHPPSLMNSFDSYHINTSLGAIELTSSLYDTSASFYSNHTILPVARMKRGFLSSVRGFLTNLKSR